MSENELIEQQTYDQFMEKLKGGDDSAEVLLLSKFPEGSHYAGLNLLEYIFETQLPDLLMFEAIHYGCENAFEAIKAKFAEVAEEDGFPPNLNANEIFFVSCEMMSNLEDQALSDQIAGGMVPDLWPVPDHPDVFGVPSRTIFASIPFNPNNLNFDELQNLTKLNDDCLEVVVKVGVTTDGTGSFDDIERLTPDEFGERSRDSQFMTLVYEFESTDSDNQSPKVFF
jgi:hypothetical protein